MTVHRTAAIANVQAMLGLPELDGTRPPHKDCLIVSCDVEDFSRNRGQPLLEVGVALLDTLEVLELNPFVDDDFAYLAKMEARHYRFQESCHIPNEAPWLSGDYNQPEKFMFGSTEFIWREQLQEIFTLMLCRKDDTGKLRHVHFVTQGGDHDRANIGNFAEPKFRFDDLLPGNTTEELQFTSKHAMREISRACNGQRPALWKILDNTGLECLHLHNAGNDAVSQLSALVILALMEWRQRYAEQNQYNPNEGGEDWPEDEPVVNEEYVEEQYTGQAEAEAFLEQHDYDEQQQEAAAESDEVHDSQVRLHEENAQAEQTEEPGLLRQVSQYLRSDPPAPLVGGNHHCTRCNSDEHDRQDCNSRQFIECQRCFRRGHHVTKHCYIRNDEYLEEKRRENWEKNWHRDLKNKFEPKKYVKLEDSALTRWDNIFETDTPRYNRRAEAEAAARARAAANTTTTPAPPAPPKRTWAQMVRATAQVTSPPAPGTAVATATSARIQADTAVRALHQVSRSHPASAQQQSEHNNRGHHTRDRRDTRIGSSPSGNRGGLRGGRGGPGGRW